MSLLVDTANLFYCVKKRHGDSARVDYTKYLEQVGDNHETRIAYVTKPDAKAIHFIKYLESLGFATRVKEPKTIGPNIRQPNWNVELTIDALQCTDNLVIGSSDIHLLPLIKFCPSKVHVFAAGIPRVFKQHATVKEIGKKLLQ